MSVSLQTQDLVVSTPKTPFLDQIELRHGPVGLLGRFLLAADQALHDRGIHLQLHTDLASLGDAYRDVQPPGNPFPVVPTYDPKLSDLSPANSFWLSAHDATGRIVGTHAARLFDMQDSNLASEFTSLRVLYADPAPYLAKGLRCRVDCPPAEALTGRVFFSGGTWYHRSVRGCGLSSIMPRVSRAIAHSTWNADYASGILETVLIEKGIHTSYGYVRHSPSIKLTGSYRGDLGFELVWMTADELLEDLRSYTSAVMAAEIRTTEATDTNRVEPRRQGSSSR